MNSNTGANFAESFAAGSLANTFAEIKDQRARRGIRYPLAPLLVLLMLAKLCGEDRPKAIAEWVALRAQALKKLLHLNWKAMPHASTYRRLMQSGVAVTELERKAREFLSGLNLPAEELLNLDSKTLRGPIPGGQTQGLHLLSLQEANSNRVLAQVEVGAKENEISAAPGLVAQVEIKGRIISGDAMQAQRRRVGADCPGRRRLSVDGER